MTVSKEQARHAEAVLGQEAPFTPRVSAALNILRQFIEQSQDSGHAAAPTDEQIIAEAKKQGLWLVTGMDNDHEPFTTNVGSQVIRTVRAFLAAPAPTQQATAAQALQRVRDFVMSRKGMRPARDVYDDERPPVYVLREDVIDAIDAALSGAAPTPQPELTDERAEFEAWCIRTFGPHANLFTTGDNNIAWVSWQARSLLGAAPTQAPQQPTRDGGQSNG